MRFISRCIPSSLPTAFALGMAKAFSGSFVPTSQLFFSGGGTTLRGFPIDEAGPQRLVPFCNVLTGQTGCVNVTVPVGGRATVHLEFGAAFSAGHHEGSGRRGFL